MGRRTMRYSLVIALAAGVLAGTGAAEAASIVGTWDGNGFVKSLSGTRENVHCRVKYRLQSGKTYILSAICTSATGKSRSVNGSVVRSRGNRYGGRISYRGTVAITVIGNRQTLTVSNPMGSGRVTLIKR